MFYNLLSRMNIKIVTNGGGVRIRGGTFLISSWKWNTSIYQYLHLYALYWIIVGHWCEIIQLFIIHVWIKCSPWKLCFQSLKSLLLAHFLTYKYQTRFIVKRKQVRIKVYGYTAFTELFFFHIKNMRISKNSQNFIVHYNFTKHKKPYKYMAFYVLWNCNEQ